MKRKGNDFLKQLINFQQEILRKKPDHNRMVEDIRMMKFKIRPLGGDIAQINFNNLQLIETLWNLGKIDDFFQKEFSKLGMDQKQIFHHFIDRLYQKFQEQLNKLRLGSEKLQPKPSLVEMEIFKERPQIN